MTPAKVVPFSMIGDVPSAQVNGAVTEFAPRAGLTTTWVLAEVVAH